MRLVNKGVKMGVSINPNDFVSGPQPLDLSDRKVVKAIHKMSFQAFVQSYIAPTLERDDYHDLKRIPPVWWRCASKVSGSHLYLYTFCALSADKRLETLTDARKSADAMCVEKGDEPGVLWLDSRPYYETTLVSSKKRKHFPGWSSRVVRWLMSTAEGYGMDGKTLFVPYSCKVLLDSGIELGGFRDLLEQEWSSFNRWIDDETRKILTKFEPI